MTEHRRDRCSGRDDGPAGVVLATVTHLNGNVWEAGFEGSEEFLEPTGRHRLYSEDRGDWVMTQELRVGEELRAKEGSVKVRRIGRLPRVYRVYNLEVETEHLYLASGLGVLSHNSLSSISSQDFESGTARSDAGGWDPYEPTTDESVKKCFWEVLQVHCTQEEWWKSADVSSTTNTGS